MSLILKNGFTQLNHVFGSASLRSLGQVSTNGILRNHGGEEDALGQEAREHSPRAVDARQAAPQHPEDEDAYCGVEDDRHEGGEERVGRGRVGAVEFADGAAGGIVARGADSGVLVLVDILGQLGAKGVGSGRDTADGNGKRLGGDDTGTR